MNGDTPWSLASLPSPFFELRRAGGHARNVSGIHTELSVHIPDLCIMFQILTLLGLFAVLFLATVFLTLFLRPPLAR